MILLVKGKNATVSTVGAYLPENYSVTGGTDGAVIVEGEDNAGWTAEGYVIPRLESGMMFTTILDCRGGACSPGRVHRGCSRIRA